MPKGNESTNLIIWFNGF